MDHNRAHNLFSLGINYLENRQGPRLQNLNNAIEAFEEASKYFLLFEYPYEWGLLQADLGLAYYSLADLVPHRDLCIREAIDHLHRSQIIINEENYPFEWAEFQNTLAGAFGALGGENKSENIEKSIKLYEASLAFFYKYKEKYFLNWCFTNNNLGTIYIDRVKGDLHENLQKAIHHFTAALSINSLGVRQDFQAQVQENLGRVYGILFLKNRDGANFENAEKCFREALRERSPELQPSAYRKAAKHLANLYFFNKQWANAVEWYEKSIQVGNQLITNSFSDNVRRDEINKTADNFPDVAYCLLKLGRYDDAINFLEQGKARTLTRTLALSDDLLSQSSPESFEKIRLLRDRVGTLESDIEAQWMLSPTKNLGFNTDDVELELQRANAELENWVSTSVGDRKILLQENDIASDRFSVIPDKGALVVLFSTRQGTAAIILPHGIKKIEDKHIVFIDDFNQNDLFNLLWGDEKNGWMGWIRSYRDAQQKNSLAKLWSSTITTSTQLLWDKVLSVIINRLLQFEVRRIVFMPQSGFQLLPLHATWWEEGEESSKKKIYLIDKYEISYISSIFVLLATSKKLLNRGGKNALVAGINMAYKSLASLPHSIDEAKDVASILGAIPLIDFDATAYEIQQRSASAHYIHLACHGTFSWNQNPLDSAIYLANDKPIPLSKIISDFKLKNARLVTLSACETGICDISNTSPDEYVGLPMGFMQAGAAGVISSLWTVDDQSTKLLMQKFYEFHIKGNCTPSEALVKAQRWLRDASIDQIGGMISTRLRLGSNEYNDEMARIFSSKKDYPYSNPFFWAAFTYTGAV